MKTSFDVLRIELLQLARDRRALFSAIVLPAILYPLLFLGMGKLEEVGEETMAERTITVQVDLERIDEATREDFLAGVVDRGPITIEHVDAAAVADEKDDETRRLAARAIMRLDDPADAAGEVAESDIDEPEVEDPGEGENADDGEEDDDTSRKAADVLIVATQDDGVPGQQRATFEIWRDRKNDDADEGASRARDALEEIEDRVAAERREVLLGGDPGAGLDIEPVDVATAEDTSGAALGKWLPFIVLLVIVSGGAYAALAVFAGEREAGTLETLLVQPVPHQSIAIGKFLAVFIAGSATLLVNLASLAACVFSGLADTDAFGGAAGGLSAARLASLALELPACLLLCAILCLVCGKARTFREGQLLIFPITLLVIVPTAIVLRPEAELTALWAVVPFSGSALALRDGLEGGLSVSMAALVVASHLAWTWLALTRVAVMLDTEKVLGGGGDAKAESHLQEAGGRHGVRWGFAVVMTVYLIAMSVQRANLDFGLWFTFWMLLPAFALAIAWTAPRDRGEPRDLLGALGLRLPRTAHLLGALLLVPALVRGALWLGEKQREILPLPPGAGDDALGLQAMFESATPLWLFFFFALSPGVWEELVFRGSMLESMRRDWSWKKIVFWQALYFALVHASIYRLIPTGILGALLALIALRSRSVIPAMLLHVTYNAVIVLGGTGHIPFVEEPWFAHLAWAGIAGAMMFVIEPRAENESK